MGVPFQDVVVPLNDRGVPFQGMGVSSQSIGFPFQGNECMKYHN